MSRTPAHRDTLPSAQDRFRLGMATAHHDRIGAIAQGEVFMTLTDARTGEVIEDRHFDRIGVSRG